jgi:hypothetical protein
MADRNSAVYHLGAGGPDTFHSGDEGIRGETGQVALDEVQRHVVLLGH